MYSNNNFSQESHYAYNMPHYHANPSSYTDSYEQSWMFNVPCDFNSQTSTETSITVALNQRKEDTEFFKNFINEYTNDGQIQNKTRKFKRLGISETRILIASINKYNTKLRELTSVLENEKNNLSKLEWQDSVKKCIGIKSEIMKLLTILHETEKICSFKNLIEKRKKKRQRERRFREKWKAEKISNAERRLCLHTAADMWIREKQAIIEQEKQEENLHKDADMILSEIRAKRSDARKFLAMLSELQNLRKAKANNARARGEKLSVAADQSFENIIAQLTEQWLKLNREYSIEEQGLKLMLKTDNERIIEKQKKSSFDDWEIAIFGRKLPLYDSAQNNLNNLIMTRFTWDKYLTFDSVGSRIPIGWVMPELASSAAWQKLLKN